mmetsp:Transcript_17537/g.48669  ORF Transcript_17537/g.48669 Transcript_17537/m.48669 type:complete len:212 (-) Transcript_17537:632-1267(-)
MGQMSVILDDGVTDGLKQSVVVAGVLRLDACASHDLNGLLKVRTVCGFSRKHNCVGSIEHCVGNIGTLGAGWAWVDDHALQHLGGSDDRLSGDVGLANHHLLRQEYLGGWDLHAEVATGHHDSVRVSQDLVVVLQSLLVFDLGDDLDALTAVVGQELSEVLDIITLAHEGGGDEVDLVLDPEVDDVIDVLFGEGWQIYDDSWEVHVLTLSK